MKLFLSGNEAIAFGLLEAGVRFISGYPGTPSSEVLPAAVKLAKQFKIDGYFNWAVNEKVAFEETTAASIANIPVAFVAKQVGLNVAMDPYMNTALVGSDGGLVVVVADDPGPHSSQTEQDSRFMAYFAKIPVLEPSTPKEAYLFAKKALNLSRQYKIPVMIRTTTRVSHSKEDIEVGRLSNYTIKAQFNKNTDRYAATPHFRYLLHKQLNEKIEKIKNNEFEIKTYFSGKKLIITSGISFAYLYDIITEYKLTDKLTIAKIDMPYPLNEETLHRLTDKFEEVIIIEEGYPVIELQFRKECKGREDGTVPKEGELTIDVIKSILQKLSIMPEEKSSKLIKPPFKRPSLCPGCGHRTAFYAIKQVFKDDAIYTGDIGCYTLGLNLKAVDTVHCMGASVSFGFGFQKAFGLSNIKKPVVATIGDSTFFHSGITPLIDAVHNNSPFIVVILDNSTVAMTGNQPTPTNTYNEDGSKATPVLIENIVKAIGVDFLKICDAYDFDCMEKALLEAKDYIENYSSPAVLIFRHPCIYTTEGLKNNPRFKRVFVDEQLCKGCKICIENFECPSLIFNGSVVEIDTTTCINCGQCVVSCPFDAIKVEK
ncbi:thiamine pyrophosphate-dependent enzyme [Hippea jasoniae]|uniref:thiamine pyrophosphate-dependent enzyme n=1 Tax=Hippea jasoniae TaxID=944479 RepID=UPI00054E7918|nr:thiamine pyrophosphate-dependent enzyme [Hippea jasoniae]